VSLATTTRALAPAGTSIDTARLKRREPDAWAALFERDYPLVFRAVLGRVGNRAVAEDIAGQVFLEALEGIGRYRDRGKPITAWLLAIARHRALDWFRKRNREAGEAVEPEAPPPEEGLGAAIAMLAELKEEQREVIHLRFVEGYSLEEVARLSGRSVGAVKSLQHRGLGRLRKLLTEEVP
jgi:RNA polymerase sigma-70 factor (ECF subfamily)